MNQHDPAFARPVAEAANRCSDGTPNGAMTRNEAQEGITRLEYFAAAALSGIKANNDLLKMIAEGTPNLRLPDAIAMMAFTDAEAMCAEAEKRRKPLS